MFHISNLPKVISLGRRGENAFRTLRFDVSPWLEEYPGGSVSLIFQRPDGALYVAAAGIIASPAQWTPTASDTAVPGEGRLEIRLTCGDVIGKSMVVKTQTEDALGAAGEPPSPAEPDWTAAVAQKAGEAALRAEEAQGYADAARDSEALAAAWAAAAQSEAADTAASAAGAASSAISAADSAAAAAGSAAAAENAAALAGSAVRDAESSAAQAAASAGLASDYAQAAGAAVSHAAAAAVDAHDSSSSAHSALLAEKAPLVSPAFSGVPTAPTAPSGTNSSQIATTAFVQSVVSSAGGGDMLQTVYDTDGDGVVNAAASLGAGAYRVLPPVLTENKTLGTAAFTEPVAYDAAGTAANAVSTHSSSAAAHAAGIAGNAATATKLQASRNIFGRTFDGSADITQPVPLENGGTGASDAAGARTNLGIGTAGALAYQTTVSDSAAHVPTGSAIVAMLGRFSSVSTADTNYGAIRARGIYAGTADMTAGSTPLTSGVLYCYYEA